MKQLLFTEKFRPTNFDDLIFASKNDLVNLWLSQPMAFPSLIFYSSAGTGKTTCAKLIADYLKCDLLIINASEERGIDTIREKVKSFAQSLSSNALSKRMILMDEAEGITSIAQNSLKSLMEEYSANCFFVFCTNAISKIIEPIQSRCVKISFSKIDKKECLARLAYIAKEENIQISEDLLGKIYERYNPDIRSMVIELQKLQDSSIEKESPSIYNSNSEVIIALQKSDIAKIYEVTYSTDFDILNFVKFFMEQLFKAKNTPFDKLRRIAKLLADIELAYAFNANLQVIFLANMLEIMNIFKE